ncbi:UNVERIFIED_CONTAM: HSP20 family protein [Brevibacillus sp. OAP136]
MKHLRETMKHFQKTAERLSKLGFNSEQPWKTLSQMNELLDGEFWENMATLGKYADQTWGEPEEQQETEQAVTKASAKAPAKKFVPNVDLFKTDTRVIVSCEISGFDRDSLEVKFIDPRTIIIMGRVREHTFAHARLSKERSYGKFRREIKLPVAVVPKKMKVEYADGVLELQFIRSGKTRRKQPGTT